MKKVAAINAAKAVEQAVHDADILENQMAKTALEIKNANIATNKMENEVKEADVKAK